MKSVLFILIVISLYFLSITIYKNKYYKFFKNDFNSLKGILSILIILAHVNFFVDMPIYKSLIQWGGTRVGLYFFISGYGLMAAKMNKGSSYFDEFFRKRLFLICKPLIIITVLYLIFDFFNSGNFNTPYIILSNLAKGITPLPYSWFVYVIVIVYFFYYLIFNNKRNELINIAIISIIILVFSFGLYFFDFDRAWWVSNLAFPLGLLFKFYENEIIKFSRIRMMQLFLVPFSFTLTLLIIFLKIEILYIFSYVFIIFSIMILLSYFKIPTGRFFSFLGNISYEIFLIHGAVLYFLRSNVLYINNNYIYIIICVLSTILLAYSYKRISKISSS